MELLMPELEPPPRLRPAEGLATRRAAGRGAVRTRGAELAGLARPLSLSRWTLPITALRVTPSPSTPAIWLALSPSIHSFLSSSTRSSVQPCKICSNPPLVHGIPKPTGAGRCAQFDTLGIVGLSGPPHEISCSQCPDTTRVEESGSRVGPEFPRGKTRIK